MNKHAPRSFEKDPGLGSNPFSIYDQQDTADLLGYRAVRDQLAIAAQEFDAGLISSPPRMIVPLAGDGVMLSMPATAQDISIHKLVNVQPANSLLGIPTIHGTVTAYDTLTGRPLFTLDGPELTGRRTASLTMLAIQEFAVAEPKEILIFGTGAQARFHIAALHEIYPACKIAIQGIDEASTMACVEGLSGSYPNIKCASGPLPSSVEVVIAVTTSLEPLYNEVAQAGRLVVGVGAFRPDMAEIGGCTLNTSTIIADDPKAIRTEAGDLLRANVDWRKVRSLGAMLRDKSKSYGPFVFKSVGTAAWDLAAARVVNKRLGLKVGGCT